MALSENFKDWQFRYQYLYATRRSEKSKKRFIGALVTDLSQLGVTPQVIEFDRQKKSASRNIYVGDLKKAKKVICTYYDTPPSFLGDYVLFDRKVQSRKTIAFLVITTVAAALLGLAGVMLAIKNELFAFDFSQPKTYLGIALLLLFFWGFGQVARGLSNRRNLIRNTSTILMMLAMMEKEQNPDIAYDFIDEGSFGERGLAVLQESLGKGTVVYLLDSVGADAPLYFKGRQTAPFAKQAVSQPPQVKVNYVFTSETGSEGFYLSKALLKKKELNMENLHQVMAAFS